MLCAMYHVELGKMCAVYGETFHCELQALSCYHLSTYMHMYNHVFSTLASSSTSTINNNTHKIIITIVRRKNTTKIIKYYSRNGLENV